MSPIYIDPPSSSPLPYLELKGDQLLGQIHELATCNNSHLSHPNLDKNPSFDENLALDYSRHPQDTKVDKVLSHDKANNLSQGFQSSTQPRNIDDGSSCSYYGYPLNHSDDQNQKEIDNKKDQKLPRKWKPSKVRIMQKMTSNIASRNNNNDNNNNNNNSIRVCSDCHTTTTPLWRSGPRGPKSLCNACGIRQRKARRAAMAATTTTIEFTKDAITPMCAESLEYKSSQQEKRKREFDHNRSHPLPLKKRGKKIDVARGSFGNNSHINNGLVSPSKINCIKATSQRTLLRDEEEGAFLLMALSCGFAFSS